MRKSAGDLHNKASELTLIPAILQHREVTSPFV